MCFCHLFTQLLSVHLVILFSSRESRSLPFSDLLHFRPIEPQSVIRVPISSAWRSHLNTFVYIYKTLHFHHHWDRYRSLATAKTIRDISIALKAHNSFWWRGPATKPFHLGNVFTDGNFQTTICCLFLIHLLQIHLCVASPPSDHKLHQSIAVFFSLLEMPEKALVWSNGPPVEMFIL